MISKESVLKMHGLSILKYGGSDGVRDDGLLESAIAESLIINHPFVDGNKRTGFLAMLAILYGGNLEIIVLNAAIYDFIIKITTGELKFEQIVEWLKANTAPL
jgi:death-on-curing protein